jgi:hypothetical protein
MMNDQLQGRGLLAEQGGAPMPGVGETSMPAPPGGELDRAQMDGLEEVIQIGRGIIYEPEIFAAVVERAQDDKVGALAESVVSVIEKIEASGKTIEPPVALGVGIALIADVADALMQIGMPEFSEEDLMAAVQAAIMIYMKSNEGRFDPAQMQQQVMELQGLMGGGAIE